MVRFAPKADKSLHRSEMTLRADICWLSKPALKYIIDLDQFGLAGSTYLAAQPQSFA